MKIQKNSPVNQIKLVQVLNRSDLLDFHPYVTKYLHLLQIFIYLDKTLKYFKQIHKLINHNMNPQFKNTNKIMKIKIILNLMMRN